jgi:hypothetical protein
MAEQPTTCAMPSSPACDTCAIALVVSHDPSGRSLVRVIHHPACITAHRTADVARANG